MRVITDCDVYTLYPHFVTERKLFLPLQNHLDGSKIVKVVWDTNFLHVIIKAFWK